jgi:hypothetical protein
MNRIGAIYIIEVIGGNPHSIGFKYVGQTTGDCREATHFNELRKNKHFNPKIQLYYNKYGEDSLKFSLLMRCQEKDLNFWERWWIKSFDSIKNGFNIAEGGNCPPRFYKKCSLTNIATKERVSCDSILEFSDKYKVCRVGISRVLSGKSRYTGGWYSENNSWRPKYLLVVSPQNIEYEICNIGLTEFCKENGIKSQGNFTAMFNGRQDFCEGWVRKDMMHRTGTYKFKKYYKLIDPEGKLHEGSRIKEFLIENELSTKIYLVLSGKKYHYKGWRRYIEGQGIGKFDIEQRKKEICEYKNEHRKTYSFIDPEGKLHHTKNLTNFAKERDLAVSGMSRLWNNVGISQYKSWTKGTN